MGKEPKLRRKSYNWSKKKSNSRKKWQNRKPNSKNYKPSSDRRKNKFNKGGMNSKGSMAKLKRQFKGKKPHSKLSRLELKKFKPRRIRSQVKRKARCNKFNNSSPTNWLKLKEGRPS